MDKFKIPERLYEIAELKTRLADKQTGAIEQMCRMVTIALSKGHKILLFGNGGSAVDAQYIAAKLARRFNRGHPPLSAMALSTELSILKTIGNDYGFGKCFARQIRALGESGDVVMAISNSGCSSNILAGVEAAHELGLVTVGLTGGDGGQLASIVDIPIIVPSENTTRVQECHITIGHILCEAVEASLFPDQFNISATGKILISEPMTCKDSKLMDWDNLLALRERWRREGFVVVWTNGCFDILHVGHIRSLKTARSFGDVLVVGVNSDESVQQLKGRERPLVPASERVEVLAALESVDYVVVFNELTPETVLSRLKPDVHCKGADYGPPNGKPIPEAKVVESYGGQVKFLPLVSSVSTSELIQRIHQRYSRGPNDSS